MTTFVFSRFLCVLISYIITTMKHLYLKTIVACLFISTCINAATYDCIVDGIYYNLNQAEKKAQVAEAPTTKDRYSGDIIIPSEIVYNNTVYTVTSIGNSAFSHCEALTNVFIPNSVDSIGWTAFGYCTSLQLLSLPNSIVSIGWSAFGGCNNLTTINIPIGLTVIEEELFYHCSSLTSVTIPENVTKIKYRAFDGCTSLTTIFIPNSVKELGESAFSGCAGLTSVYLGNGIEKLQDGAFAYCTGLTDVYCYASECPITSNFAFEHTDTGITTLHVPASSVSAYKEHNVWKKFKEVVALTDEEMALNIVSPKDRFEKTDKTSIRIYDLNGHRLNTLKKGPNIIKTSDGRMVKVMKQ